MLVHKKTRNDKDTKKAAFVPCLLRVNFFWKSIEIFFKIY